MTSKKKQKRGHELHKVTWYSKVLSVIAIVAIGVGGYGFGLMQGLNQDKVVLGPDTLTKYQAAQVIDGVSTLSPQLMSLLEELFQFLSPQFSSQNLGQSLGGFPQGTPVSQNNSNDLSQTDPDVTWSTDDTYRYVTTNALPDHDTGAFPNSGNPNTISAQDQEYRVMLDPVFTGVAIDVRLPGVAINGIPLEPGTAETEVIDGVTLNIEGLGTVNLGMDDNNAHVQPTGLYHYHGVPEALVAMLADEADTSSDLVHVAYAADGFPMYVSQSSAYDSSYELLDGHDGTYTQDFEYVDGSGNLDACNGVTIDGEYGYIITDDFPFIGRCVYGTPDASFSKGPGSGGNFGPGGFGQNFGQRPPPPHDQFIQRY
jgi:hypothetical protein